MTKILLSSQFISAITSGRKISTIRRGHRLYPLGLCILKAKNTEILVTITRVRYCICKDLTVKDAINDGFETLEALQIAIKQFYSNITPEDDVTIIEFNYNSQQLSNYS